MINKYNKNHKGHLPIRVLQYNVLHKFENTNPKFLSIFEDACKRYDLSTEIAYCINKNKDLGEKLVGPFVRNSEIHIQETFLAYLWCTCYSLYIFSSNLIAPENEKYSGKIEMANKLMSYAQSLIKKYNDWDRCKLVNPELYDEKDKEDVEKTNDIFIHAFNFILCHEFCHVKCGHNDKLNNGKDLTDTERQEFEVEADKCAIELLTTGLDVSVISKEKIGITTAICSILFVRNSVANRRHPDTDIRITTAIDQFEVDDNHSLWVLACASIGIWQELFNIDLYWEDKVSFKELFRLLSQQLA